MKARVAQFWRAAQTGVLFLAATVLAVFGTACASSKNSVKTASSGKVFAVTAEKTAFFRYGPQQGNGPDESLAKNTLMTLIRPSFGYCKVHLVATSQEGYVASEDIQPASATLIAALNPPVQASTSSSTSSTRENFDLRSSGPAAVPPPETLPAPDLPPAAAEPSPQ